MDFKPCISSYGELQDLPEYDGGADGIIMVGRNHFEPAVASVLGLAPQVLRR